MLENKVCALSLGALMSALLGASTLAATENALSSTRNALSDDSWQINPAMNLSSLFPDADRISLAVAVIPDPLVPRYRRLYDLELVAIELGMLRNGYVLDRFYLPWNDKLRAASDPQHAGSADTPALPVDRGAYGLLLFRCDSWRHVEDKDESPAEGAANGSRTDAPMSECSAGARTSGGTGHGTRFRALYVVTDTSTKGVENRSLRCVTDRIASQLPTHAPRRETDCWLWQGEPGASQPKVDLMSYPAKCGNSASTLVMLGPTFSGAVDSVGEWSERLRDRPSDLTHFCVVSSSTTDDTNDLVSVRYPLVTYSNLAVNNRDKLLHLALLMPALTGRKDYSAKQNRVAILAEASTFGQGVCNARKDSPDHSEDENSFRRFCAQATFFTFRRTSPISAMGCRSNANRTSATAA